MPRKASKINKKNRPEISKSVNLQTSSYLDKIENEIKSNQSKLNMVLGALIVLVIGVLIFNYFNKNKSDLGPAQNTTSDQQQDVALNNLPGKYTVKEGDTLFDIAIKYYNDGYKYTEIAKTNNITNPDIVTPGQVLEIPKLESTASTLASPVPSQSPAADTMEASKNTTEWGAKITGDSYTVQAGDWLSTIAGRAYGDIYAYEKISKANNITDPNNIEINTVIQIPR